jgi:hypothetical protein
VLLAFSDTAGWTTEVGATLAMGLGVGMILLGIGAGLRTREPRVTDPAIAGK